MSAQQQLRLPDILSFQLAKSAFLRTKRLLKVPAWRLARLQHRLPSGLLVKIQSPAEWLAYSDIFANGMYDPAIETLLRSSDDSSQLKILDLGANVGFFSFRVADLLSRSEVSPRVHFTLVEGSPQVFRKLQKRLAVNPQLQDKMTLIHGLVGRREGSARIAQSDFHVTNRVRELPWPFGVSVPFFDLSNLYSVGDVIHLLKCDIEGLEEAFLETYPTLLSMARAAVFEFHHYHCSRTRCIDLLTQAGLTHSGKLHESPGVSVELFCRP